MDVTFNNVLEGTRQYFMGLPKAQTEGSGQPVWLAGAPPPEEGALAQSGAPAATSRPPSAAAAPPSATTSTPAHPRPPSEPLEPEPHIIHKATVMREAAEKRREQPSPDEEEEPVGALSPPSHIIRKPTPRALPSPAPAPAAPAPSPARPPSAAPIIQQQPPEQSQPESSASYRSSMHRVQTATARPPDLYAPSRPPDPYSTSRPPESYSRYHYESTMPDGGRSSLGPPVPSPQPSAARHSPHLQQTYARLSSTMPQHAASRLRDSSAQSPPTQRNYAMPPTPSQPQPNDRVPPIHHPQTLPPQRLTPLDSRSQQIYAPLPHRRESATYTRVSSHYDRHASVSARKYDPQQAYPGYRPSPPVQPIVQNHRIDTHSQAQYKYSIPEVMNQHYVRQPERPVAPPPQIVQHDSARLTPRVEYPNMSRSVDSRAYHYATPSTSAARYPHNASVPVVQNTSSLQSRPTHRPTSIQKASYEYSAATQVQTSPIRSSAKSGYQNQQARMTVSVTTLVNQMNQTKQKRESPLDLSVKTVKNSADSSTTQDDLIDSASMENKPLQSQQRPTSSNRLTSQAATAYVASHKVDFAPDFSQYRERNVGHNYNNNIAPSVHTPTRYNGAYETPRAIAESYPAESRHQVYPETSKAVDRNNLPAQRSNYVPRIDLTRSVVDERLPESRIRDDRHTIIEERKRPAGSIVSNIPEKIVRYETWSSDSRIDRLSRSSRELHELMSRPVYSYSSHKRFEAYQNEQKRSIAPSSNVYRESSSNLSPQVNNRYPYQAEPISRERSDHHPYYHDRNLPNNSRHVIQKIPSHREIYSHPPTLDSHSGVPADKRVLSILRNSLETKQTGYVDPAKPSRQITDLIVIDDADDADDTVIEITDLTKENDSEMATRNKLSKPIENQVNPNFNHHIQMPKAVDSIARDSDYQKFDSPEPKSKSPENDVASRIRTKAELKVLPPSQDTSVRSELQPDLPNENEKIKLLPKSQKQHLFNQIREDLRLESVIKTEKQTDILIPEVKTEPMNIEEIEKDAQMPIKTEHILEDFQVENSINISNIPEDDSDWASACDSFVEQLKIGCIKKKIRKKRDTFSNESEDVTSEKIPKIDIPESSLNKTEINLTSTITIKEEPLDEEYIETQNQNMHINLQDVTLNMISENIENNINLKKKCNSEVQNQNLKTIIESNKEMNNIDNKDISENNKIDKLNSKIENKMENSLKEKSEYKKDKDKSHTKNKDKHENKNEKTKHDIRNTDKDNKVPKGKAQGKIKLKSEKHVSPSTSTELYKKDTETMKTIIKEESESTDDDEPLIKSKLLKEKEKSDLVKFQLMKDLTEKSAYVKLECCDVEMRKSVDSTSKEKEGKPKGKMTRQTSRSKGKSLPSECTIQEKQKQKGDSSSDSDDDDLCVASRLRLRKSAKIEENKIVSGNKSLCKSPSKKIDTNISTNSTLIRKPFGDGSDFHPGWEEELYRYKRSLRMPARLIAIPRGRSRGPFGKGSGSVFTRGSTSLPDLDPAPLSPAPSSAPSAATDDLFTRRPDKLIIDSDLDSNSSCSAVANRLHYDSEASTSTVFSSTNIKKKASSIVDVLIQKCGRREDTKKKSKEKALKLLPKSSTNLLATSSSGLLKNNNKVTLSAKKEATVEDALYLGAYRKETAYSDAFIKNTDGLIGATDEFAPIVLKTRTRTESRVLKQRATIKEVFGDERPASAPPTSYRDEEIIETTLEIKKEPESKTKVKPKKLVKDKFKRRSSSIRDGLRSTQSLKRNDAKGRLLRLKKRNNLINSMATKKIKELANNKHKKDKSPTLGDTNKTNDDEEKNSAQTTEGTTKRRLKRLFTRRKFSSGFDYIRKKKKILRRDDAPNKVRRQTVKPSPESVHDIQKEIKGWFINKSVGETHLHRAARLGYTDCVAYCLEKMGADPSAKDNAGFTALHVAAAKGHVRIGRLLLQYGANVSAAAQGGIRPLHEACENCHVEMIRLLLAYGADPLLVTYTGQTPEEIADGTAATLLRLHIADVQGRAIEPWRFPPPSDIIDREEEGCDPLASPPPSSPPPPESTVEIQCTEAPLPPFYSLKPVPGQPADGLWCLLQDVTNLLQIKSKESLLKQIHCGSGSPKELLREIRTQEFLERAQCHQLLCAGEKMNIRASKVALIRVTDKLRQLLKIETILLS